MTAGSRWRSKREPARRRKVVEVLAFDDDTAAFYSVGQVAMMLEVQQAFLRRLDTFDVVTPARSTGDQRRYSRTDVRRVQEALTLIREGFSLVGIRRVFELQAEVAALQAEIRQLRADESRG